MPVVRTCEMIPAPPAIVWRHLVDTARYPEWNPLIRSFRGELREGTDISFQIALGTLQLPIKARVVRAGGNELRWEGPAGSRWLSRIAHGSHYFRLTKCEGGTQLEHGEYFGGPAFELAWPAMNQRLHDGYSAFNRALKERATSAADK